MSVSIYKHLVSDILKLSYKLAYRLCKKCKLIKDSYKIKYFKELKYTHFKITLKILKNSFMSSLNIVFKNISKC